MKAHQGFKKALLIAASAIASGLVAPPALAQPANNNCGAATPILLGQTLPVDTRGASNDGGTPPCAQSYQVNAPDVWYAFTPAQAGEVTIILRTRGDDIGVAAFNGVLSLHAECGQPAFACSPAFSFRTYQVDVSLQGGVTVLIRVGASNLASLGTGIGFISVLPAPHRPANDNCATAAPVVAGQAMSFDNAGATNDSSASCDSYRGPDVWFTFTPPITGRAKIQACVQGSSQTAMSAYAGCGQQQLGCGLQDQCGGNGGLLIVPAQAGVPILIRVDAVGFNASSSGSIFVRQDSGPPVNGNCAGATPIGASETASFEFDSYGAPGSFQSRSAWFSFTPASAGWATISTSNCEYFELYDAGCASGGRRPDSGRVRVEAGQQLLIRAVGGTFDRFMAPASSLSISALEAAPANDLCASATPIALGDSLAFDTTLAQYEGAASGCAEGESPDVWFSYLPVSSGLVTMTLCGGFDAQLAVHPGCDQPPRACADEPLGACEHLNVRVEAGVPVLVRVTGRAAAVGAGTLAISPPPPPPSNDLCSAATPISLGQALAFDTSFAFGEGAVSCAFSSGGPDVWFAYTPLASGVVTVSLCGSAFDTALSVFASCGDQLPMACNDDFCEVTSQLDVPVTAGRTMLIRVAGYDRSAGMATIAIQAAPQRPANDDCGSAAPIALGQLTAFTTRGATNDASATCDSSPVVAALPPDVWFSYTPVRTGAIAVSALGYQVVLTAFDGCGQTASACSAGRIESAAVAGRPILIRVSGYEGVTGDGQIVIGEGGLSANGITIVRGPEINPANGHRYYLLDLATWTDAEAAGRAFGAPLATINDEAENEWLRSNFGSRFYGSLWIGLNDVAEEGTFVWAGGEAASYRNWQDGQPDNAGGVENFVELIDNGQWNDLPNDGYADGRLAILEVAPCRVDFNADSRLDPDDLSDYISCYFAQPPCDQANFNGDGAIDPDDLSDFITAYFAGC